jgi:hypothetical protein
VVSISAQAVQAAEAGIRQIGALAHQQTMCMLESATLFFYLKPAPPTPRLLPTLFFHLVSFSFSFSFSKHHWVLFLVVVQFSYIGTILLPMIQQ